MSKGCLAIGQDARLAVRALSNFSLLFSHHLNPLSLSVSVSLSWSLLVGEATRPPYLYRVLHGSITAVIVRPLMLLHPTARHPPAGLVLYAAGRGGTC